MKKTFISILTISLLGGFLFSSVLAAEDLVGEVSFSQLETEEPAILVGNPFYSFQKRFRLGVKRFFASDSQDISLKQQSLTETAAGVKKIFDLQSNNEELLLEALAEYQKEVTVYKLVIVNLVKGGEELVDASGALVQALTHLQLSDDLSGGYFSSEVMAVLIDVQDQLTDVIDVLLVDMLGTRAGRGVLAEWSSESLTNQIRSWEVIDLVTDRLDAKDRLLKVLVGYNFGLEQKIEEQINALSEKALRKFESDLINLAGSHRWVESR